MQTNPSLILAALEQAGYRHFSGSITPLGGGEMNDTYRLTDGETSMVMRISKDAGVQTLHNEAQALARIDTPGVPRLIYFDESSKIAGRHWILEEYLPGSTTDRLTSKQFYVLGRLLASVHTHQTKTHHRDIYKQFIDACRFFGDEEYLRNHPHTTLRKLLGTAFNEFKIAQPKYDSIVPALIHSDVSPSNILVDGDDVRLIDWELSKFSDPMRDFSTIYYEDIEYNNGKWRIKITDPEKQVLFSGYESAGARIDEDRIRFWIRFDKLGAAVFLYWRINNSLRTSDSATVRQYKLDFANILASLSTTESSPF